MNLQFFRKLNTFIIIRLKTAPRMSDQQISYNNQNDEDQNRNQNSYQTKKLAYVVPNAKTKLRACTHCRLIKSQQQWRDSKACENCGDFNSMEGETTDKFVGITSILNDGPSWVRRKKKLAKNKLVLGAYAVKLNL